ncbi:activator-dependent family glycosyltransferase [Actinoalloteichus sp. GBA129-24]|uniref:activator-dependent family glycosyltransferase n=1 Tax=Actinoalloteichus sp. GBA129-24 TaxID=1612551 RepID=UPI0009509EFE|nr:activator-dependent family glycosyltransferase [Actinoalloteichus sp. GBA129-24]APU21342.1 glycosyl transferase, UDP-glucuronosyltransferase [Actinoalloteichus sp. GBA129-24]
MNRLRVLFVTGPWNSHLYQMVPLAWALRSAGHEVRVASEPEFTDSITEAGLTAVPVGPDETLQERLHRIRGENAPKMAAAVPPFLTDSLFALGEGGRTGLPWDELSWFLGTVVVPGMWIVNDELVEDLVTYCRFWKPDLVLCDVIAHAGAVAADAVGAAHARMVCWNDLFLRIRHDFLRAQEQQPADERLDPVREWYAGWARKYGRDFSEEVVTGQFAVNILPEQWRLEPHERTLSMSYVPYNGRSVVPSWLNEAPRVSRVLMTFGISKAPWIDILGMSVAQVQEALDSMADLDIELILTLSDEERDQLVRVPDNTRVVEFVPMNVLLPSCSVVIHHGGAGCFNGAMVHGVPQLIVESSVDAVAKRTVLRETGAGLSIAMDELTGPRVRECVTRMLEEDGFLRGAERLQRQALDLPTPVALVSELERITEEFCSRPRGSRVAPRSADA